MIGDVRERLTGVGSAVASLRRGELVALVAVVAYLLFLGASAATAPPLDVGTAGEEGTETYVGVQGSFRDANGYAVVLGPNGSTRWESPEAWAHFDVDRLPDGRILAGFMVRNQLDCGPYDPPCARTGFRVYDPDRADPVVREWTIPVRSHVNSEAHDATMLPGGEVAVSDMEHERVVVVDRSGEVVWQWNASSYYDAPADPTRTDWLHVNDLDSLGDGRFLVSVRNANQLLVVDRQEGVVEVVNGDRDPAVLDEQHNPQYLGPGRVLVADSGNDRVVELRRNDSGEWEVAWQLHGAGGIGFEWPRDADLLANGNVLVTDTFNDRLVEVTRNGSLVWSTSTRPIPYEADRNGTEYPRAVSNVTEGPAGGPTATNGDRTTDLPLLPEAYGGFAGTVPVPHWFGLPQFVGLVATLLVVVVGLVSSVVARVR